jgi:CBS domain-containing protein
MTRPPITVREDDSLRTAAALMSRRGVSGLPVLSAAGRLAGVLSQKDVLRVLHDRGGLALPGGLFALLLDPEEAGRADLLPRNRALLSRTAVREAMSRPAITVEADRSIDEATRTMLEHHVNRLPVTRAGRLAGIVTRHDLLTGIGRAAAPV